MAQTERKRKRQINSRRRGKRRIRSKKIVGNKGLKAALLLLIGITVVFGMYGCIRRNGIGFVRRLDVDASRPDMDVQLLDINEYSRPGTATEEIKGIVIHYTANPGSTAQENRDYFNSLQDGHGTSVSSHFVVGIEGEIVQCIPTAEIAYASNERNIDTVSIECCHPDESGKFTNATYKSMVHLTAFLCEKFGLTEEEVIRHYDVTGKNCPKYFVENEKAWNGFKEDIKAALERSEASKAE